MPTAWETRRVSSSPTHKRMVPWRRVRLRETTCALARRSSLRAGRRKLIWRSVVTAIASRPIRVKVANHRLESAKAN